MSLYSFVQSTVDDLDIGQLVTIDEPGKLKAFRKFLSEIGKKDHKKFTTKLKDGQLHIMRIKYHSVIETLESNG